MLNYKKFDTFLYHLKENVSNTLGNSSIEMLQNFMPDITNPIFLDLVGHCKHPVDLNYLCHHIKTYGNESLFADRKNLLEMAKVSGLVAMRYSELPEARNDKEIAIYAVSTGGVDVLSYFSKEIQKDREIALLSAKAGGWELPEYFKDDKEFVLELVKSGDIKKHHSIGGLKTKEFVLEMVKTAKDFDTQYIIMHRFGDKELIPTKEDALEFLNASLATTAFLPQKLQEDEDILCKIALKYKELPEKEKMELGEYGNKEYSSEEYSIKEIVLKALDYEAESEKDIDDR